MKFFWDTSAAINAVVSKQVRNRLDQDEHFYRLHLLSEFFAVMVRKGILFNSPQGNPERLIMSASDCARWLKDFTGRARSVELHGDELLAAMDQYPVRVSADKIFDLGHCLAAQKVNADVLLTRDTGDFQILGMQDQAGMAVNARIF